MGYLTLPRKSAFLRRIKISSCQGGIGAGSGCRRRAARDPQHRVLRRGLPQWASAQPTTGLHLRSNGQLQQDRARGESAINSPIIAAANSVRGKQGDSESGQRFRLGKSAGLMRTGCTWHGTGPLGLSQQVEPASLVKIEVQLRQQPIYTRCRRTA